jgi:hypothetical protein
VTETDGDGPPEDDLSVEPDCDLYRRVPPDHWRLVGGEFEIREGAFKNFPQPERKRMSVVLGDTLDQLERDPNSILPPGREDYGVVALKAAAVRAECQRVMRSRTNEEPAHGDVYGDKPPSRRKRLVPLATWVVYPTVTSQ